MISSIIYKLQKNHYLYPQPVIAFLDFDGTLYTAGKTMWKAPYYNHKTMRIFRRNHIPFVIVTGRPDWDYLSEIEAKVCGLDKADGIITGAGSLIYYRDQFGTLVKDLEWQSLLSKSTITAKTSDKIVTKIDWSREEIILRIREDPELNFLNLAFDNDGDFVVRYNVKKIHIEKLEKIKNQLKFLFPDGVKILIAEKLIQKNTNDIFSGDILLLPSASGKANAIEYMLKKASERLNIKLHAYIFGDSSIDIKMLSVKSEKEYVLSQYGVNLQPRTKKILKEITFRNPQLKIFNIEGPHAIYEVFKNLETQHNFYPYKARNDVFRRLLFPLEGMLDQIHGDHLSADDISMLGLKTVIDSIDQLYGQKSKHKSKIIQALVRYGYGNLTDVLDGIRARRNKTIKPELQNGQLVDVFCDRVKEFYQLLSRSEERFKHNEDGGYITLLTAISCILPSIARAQAESLGLIVKENDKNGGSMLSRTRKLIQSLFLDITGQHLKSFLIDKDIYDTNRKTFKYRLSLIKSEQLTADAGLKRRENFNNFQKEALERWLMLIKLLQEEDLFVLQFLKKYPKYFYRYDKEFKKNLKFYLKLNIGKFRKNWNFKESNLSLTNFIS